MERLFIVSNRLPVTVNFDKKGEEAFNVVPSVGGLATGMKSIYKQYESTWFGWPGFFKDDIAGKTVGQIEHKLEYEKCQPVYIDENDFKLYYSGFSNKTLWPLFHYFMQYVDYDESFYKAYVKVNQIFADQILCRIQKGDKIWIHDYHLLLLPQLIRKKFPDVSIGFFLHIPFPSYELFRVLPWRNEILKGILGADLIGFHTFDYERHFRSRVRRIFGHETIFNQIKLKNRIVKTEVFPMGIDYDKFHNASLRSNSLNPKKISKFKKEILSFHFSNPDRKLLLSIDRLDYSKGIPNRLYAFEYFLEKYPQYQGTVSLVMLEVPSRTNVEEYQLMKSEIDELVGRINGEYASIGWTPVWYFYRSLPFEHLIELYNMCDIALVTPVRDGMNLVAKEFIACKTEGKGVLILSEMAGACSELNETLTINPNNKKQIADTLYQALQMPLEDQKEIITKLQDRIKRYDVKRWAHDFIDSLKAMTSIQNKYLSKKITPEIKNQIISRFRNANKRVLFLDYDGTLVKYEKNPTKIGPDAKLYNLLDKISKKSNTDIVLVTGRSKWYFSKWFENKDYALIAEHGYWLKEKNKDWSILEHSLQSNEWKEMVFPVIQFYTDRTPGSMIEEKHHTISWHYRNADPDLSAERSIELKEELSSLIANLNLEILEGNKVLEVKSISFNKGKAAKKYLAGKNYEFIMAIGDDFSDEYLYQQLPDNSISIKAGINKTLAAYNLESFKEVRELLNTLSATTLKDGIKHQVVVELQHS